MVFWNDLKIYINIFYFKYGERNDVIFLKKCCYFKGEIDIFKIYKFFGLINMYVDCNIVVYVLVNDNKL